MATTFLAIVVIFLLVKLLPKDGLSKSERQLKHLIREQELGIRLEELKRRHNALIDENYRKVISRGD